LVDFSAFGADLGHWTVANSAFCDRPVANNSNVGINTCHCCRDKIHSFFQCSALLPCHSLFDNGSYWQIIGGACAVQVERRAACAAIAVTVMAGRASLASPVLRAFTSSLPLATLSPTTMAAASGTPGVNETLLTSTAAHITKIFFDAAAVSDITATATPANRLAPALTVAMVTNTASTGSGSGSGSIQMLTLPSPKTITVCLPAYL
jgi:hypothetical protein